MFYSFLVFFFFYPIVIIFWYFFIGKGKIHKNIHIHTLFSQEEKEKLKKIKNVLFETGFYHAPLWQISRESIIHLPK